jgi:hypothetical protein
MVIGGGTGLLKLSSPGTTTVSVAISLSLKAILDFPKAPSSLSIWCEGWVKREGYPSIPIERRQVLRRVNEVATALEDAPVMAFFF